MKTWFSIFFLSVVSAFAAPPAQYVPRSIKELDDAKGVTLSINMTPIWDGTKFKPRALIESDITSLESDLTLKQTASTKLTGLAAVTYAADKGIYATSATSFATFTLPSFSRTTLALASAVLWREALAVRHNIDVLTVTNPLPLYPEAVLNPSGTPSVDISKWGNTLAVSGDKTVMFSEVPSDGQTWALEYHNTDSSSHTMTIPESWSRIQNKLITTFTLPPGRAKLYWEFSTSTGIYYVTGEPFTVNDLTADSTPVSTDSLWEYDASAGAEKKATIAAVAAAMGIYFGANTPEGAVTAPVGSLFLRSNGGANTTLYIKESGASNTGWIGK